MVIFTKKLPYITQKLPGYYPELPKITWILPENYPKSTTILFLNCRTTPTIVIV